MTTSEASDVVEDCGATSGSSDPNVSLLEHFLLLRRCNSQHDDDVEELETFNCKEVVHEIIPNTAS